MFFTVFAGAILAVGLAAIAKFANLKWQIRIGISCRTCLLNAVSLVDLFFIAATTTAHSDAANMPPRPAFPNVWLLIWMGVSVAMISVGLRLYAVSKNKAAADDSLFDN